MLGKAGQPCLLFLLQSVLCGRGLGGFIGLWAIPHRRRFRFGPGPRPGLSRLDQTHSPKQEARAERTCGPEAAAVEPFRLFFLFFFLPDEDSLGAATAAGAPSTRGCSEAAPSVTESRIRAAISWLFAISAFTPMRSSGENIASIIASRSDSGSAASRDT